MKHSTHSLICFWLISISTHVCSHRTRASVHKSLIFCQIWDLFNQRKIRVLNAKKKIRKETRLSPSHSLAYIIYFFRLTTTTSVFRCVLLLFFTYIASNESSFRYIFDNTVNLEFGDYKWESILRHLFMCTVHYVF